VVQNREPPFIEDEGAISRSSSWNRALESSGQLGRPTDSTSKLVGRLHGNQPFVVVSFMTWSRTQCCVFPFSIWIKLTFQSYVFPSCLVVSLQSSVIMLGVSVSFEIRLIELSHCPSPDN
jgi:hypothetical protein